MNELDKIRDTAARAVDAFEKASHTTLVAAGAGQPWTASLVLWLTFGIMAFAVIVLVFMWLVLKAGYSPSDTLRLATMPMVIASAIFLVLLGFSNEQMTPVIGLLGTLIGYVLGSATTKCRSEPASVQNTSLANPSGLSHTSPVPAKNTG